MTISLIMRKIAQLSTLSHFWAFWACFDTYIWYLYFSISGAFYVYFKFIIACLIFKYRVFNKKRYQNTNSATFPNIYHKVFPGRGCGGGTWPCWRELQEDEMWRVLLCTCRQCEEWWHVTIYYIENNIYYVLYQWDRVVDRNINKAKRLEGFSLR